MALKRAVHQKIADKVAGRSVSASAARQKRRDAENSVIDAINELADDRIEAERWFRTQKIPAYDGLTLEEVVKKHGASSAISYVEGMKAGVFA